MTVRKKPTQKRYTIESLKPGDVVPKHEPKRYPNSSGYVRLRWRVAPWHYVEAYEHRVVKGRVTTAPQVHHINHDRADNRAENLVAVDTVEHGRHHRKLDHALMVAMYAEGMSTPQVAAELGTDPSVVYRAVRNAGGEIRSISESLELELDEDRIRELHAQGVRARAIAKELGCSAYCIDRRFRKLGLPPFRTGRAPKVAP